MEAATQYDLRVADDDHTISEHLLSRSYDAASLGGSAARTFLLPASRAEFPLIGLPGVRLLFHVRMRGAFCIHSHFTTLA